VLPREAAGSPEHLARFEQEARAASALNHPNILAAYDIGSHEGLPYFVTELLEGQSLADKVAHGALPVRKALEYGVQAASGLAAAHQRGIVHRDLKPANLFPAAGVAVRGMPHRVAEPIGWNRSDLVMT
jgi:serine/threonine protein kinase